MQLKGLMRGVYSVAFSPDGKRVLTGSDDKTARLWEASSGRELERLEGHTDVVRNVAFSPDGKQVLTGSYDGTARLWEASSGRELERFEGHTDQVYSVAFSPDGKQILTNSGNGTMRLREVSSAQERIWLGGFWVSSMAFSPNSRLIVTCDKRGYVYFWRSQEAGRLLGIYVSRDVGALCWQDETHVILADHGGSRGRPRLYRLELVGMRG
jgi:eukaryotic-like serine/threonine-protein kinase